MQVSVTSSQNKSFLDKQMKKATVFDCEAMKRLDKEIRILYASVEVSKT